MNQQKKESKTLITGAERFIGSHLVEALVPVALENSSITGESIAPFFSEGLEGFDINNIEDLILAEYYISNDQGVLPHIKIPPYQIDDFKA